MYALWRPASPSGASPMMLATLHGLTLRVEPRSLHDWRWHVVTPSGIELECGDAPTLVAAESEAELEVLAVHPPGSTWVAHCLD